MNSNRELMRQALEALEAKTASIRTACETSRYKLETAAITALRERLAQQSEMDEAIAAGDGTLHGAIDHWQERALQAEAELAQQQSTAKYSDLVSDGGLDPRNAFDKPARQEQEPVAMRMPKEGDRVICIEDDSAGTVQWTSAAGGPYIKFDDGSYGQWSLREFGTLFRYATAPQPAQQPLTDEQIKTLHDECNAPTGHEFVMAFARAIEAAHGIKEQP